MDHELTATLCQTSSREPLAVVEGLPGGGAELTPVQPRALADGLLPAKRCATMCCRPWA